MQDPDFPTPDPGLQAFIEEFSADVGSVERRWRLPCSVARLDRMDRLVADYQERLAGIPFEKLSHAGQIDYALMRNHLARRRTSARQIEEERRIGEMLPFAPTVAEMDEAMTAMRDLDPQDASSKLDGLAKEMRVIAPPVDALAVQTLGELRTAMDRWGAFYLGYDPEHDWWIREPLKAVTAEFERLGQPPPEDGEIPGRPVGREAILEDLAFEMAPYSPERLIEIGSREYEWCLVEMRKAAAEMGFGDDWMAALEAVKETCLPPGAQPSMVRDLAWEAIEYVSELVTVPELAKETWRMEMMSPERQKVSPFFLGGETIIVSYPTDTMSHEEKRMSMRGNNPNFSRATVQHELIPGHHLQMYMAKRHRPYRKLFSTPFWIEGWTLYWELLLWELGFPRTPQERIGMLFWRMHRCVRVEFSLRFHLGELSTADCVEMLVGRVGHERLNAEGEVRRSFKGLYPPLYQAAYLIGGLQFRRISRELRDAGWTYRQVHDGMMRENQMPPAMLRLALQGIPPSAIEPPIWRFDD